MPVSVVDWRTSVTGELRQHLVHKMIQAALLIYDSATSISAMPQQIVSKLNVVENQFYEEANSRSEYYQMVAQKIFDIQKFIQEEQMRSASESTLEMPASVVDWRNTVTDGLRQHIVNKMVQAVQLLIVDSNNPISVMPQQIVSKLKVVENQFYEEANSRSEYYHMVAEKIYNLQKFIYEEQMRIGNETNASESALEDKIASIGTMIEELLLS